MTKKGNLWFFVVIMALLAACDTAPEPTPTLPPTPVPTNTPVPPTDTPEPTATFTPEPTLDLTATAAAEATATAEAELAEVEAVLKEYNVSNVGGHLAWMQKEDVRLGMTGYRDWEREPAADGMTFANFVLHVDVTWNTEFGWAGCGLIFRSEKDIVNGQQYQFFALRLAGLPLWDVELWRYGQWVTTVTGRLLNTGAISVLDDSTNKYVLVVKGTTMTIYANGTRMGNVNLATRSDGVLAYYGWQDSGESYCTFANAWVWVFD